MRIHRHALAAITFVSAACSGGDHRVAADAAVDSSLPAYPADSLAPAAGNDPLPAPTAVSELNASAATGQEDYVVNEAGIGRVRLGWTLDEVRRALPRATIKRRSDGDGAALVEVALAPDTALVVYAGEDDADAAIDWTRRVEIVEAFGPAFHTIDGVRVGMLVSDVARIFGKITEISLSEIESRQYVTFEKQPGWLTMRLDYTGVFADGTRTTTKHEPNARVFSLAVAR